MSYTALATNSASGGVNLASEVASGLNFPVGNVAFGPDGGPFLLVGVNQPMPVSLGDGQKKTFSSSTTGLVTASSATDIFELNNSAGTKTLKLVKIELTGYAGTAVTIPVNLIKRTTLNSAGTASTVTVVPHVTGDTATGVAKSYTANPTTGTSAGNVVSSYVTLPLTATALPYLKWEFGTKASEKSVTLAANESLVLNIGGTTVSSSIIGISSCWTEE